MQITVTFNSLNELKAFTEKVLVGDTGSSVDLRAATQEPAQQTPVQKMPTAPAAPVAPVAPAAPTAPAAPAAPTAPAAPAAPVPTTQVSYKPDDLARAAMSLMDSGRQPDLISLLGQFGVVSIPDLRPEQYGAFATALRGMGLRSDGALHVKPSGAHRWLACTPSAVLERQFPDQGSDAAAEGTLAHELAELKLRNFFQAADFGKTKFTPGCEHVEKGSAVEGRDAGLHGYISGLCKVPVSWI